MNSHREAAQAEHKRIQRYVDYLHSRGLHAQAERLTEEAERADLDAESWEAATWALRKVGPR
jgi:hypothetical protein